MKMKDALAKLSPAEQAVFIQLFKGQDNEGIAAALGLARRTVAFHLNRIYKKTDSTSRAHLMSKFTNYEAPVVDLTDVVLEMSREIQSLKIQMQELTTALKNTLPVPLHGNKI